MHEPASRQLVRRDLGPIGHLDLGPPQNDFDMAAFLESVSTPEAFKQSQALAAVYDKAVLALIGPNDVQIDGKRTFKKKSAWLKLARHFSIQTVVIDIHGGWDLDDEHFTATVTKRAIAPWGQVAEAVGVCSTHEKRFQYDKQKAVADCTATADTRAGNRCISNLIAMGEVSAEEAQAAPGARLGYNEDGVAIMPLGDDEFTGKLLTDASMPIGVLLRAHEWVNVTEKRIAQFAGWSDSVWETMMQRIATERTELLGKAIAYASKPQKRDRYKAFIEAGEAEIERRTEHVEQPNVEGAQTSPDPTGSAAPSANTPNGDSGSSTPTPTSDTSAATTTSGDDVASDLAHHTPEQA